MGEREVVLTKQSTVAGVDYKVGDVVSVTEKQRASLIRMDAVSAEKPAVVTAPAVVIPQNQAKK